MTVSELYTNTKMTSHVNVFVQDLSGNFRTMDSAIYDIIKDVNCKSVAVGNKIIITVPVRLNLKYI